MGVFKAHVLELAVLMCICTSYAYDFGGGKGRLEGFDEARLHEGKTSDLLKYKYYDEEMLQLNCYLDPFGNRLPRVVFMFWSSDIDYSNVNRAIVCRKFSQQLYKQEQFPYQSGLFITLRERYNNCILTCNLLYENGTDEKFVKILLVTPSAEPETSSTSTPSTTAFTEPSVVPNEGTVSTTSAETSTTSTPSTTAFTEPSVAPNEGTVSSTSGAELVESNTSSTIIISSTVLTIISLVGIALLSFWCIRKRIAEQKTTQQHNNPAEEVYDYVPVDVIPFYAARALATANKKIDCQSFVPAVSPLNSEPDYDYVYSHRLQGYKKT